jgi:hypothetical protein
MRVRRCRASSKFCSAALRTHRIELIERSGTDARRAFRRVHEDAAQIGPARAATRSLPTWNEGVEVLQVIAIAQAVHGDQHPAVRLFEDVAQLLGSQCKIYGHRDRACSGNRVLDGDELGKIGK